VIIVITFNPLSSSKAMVTNVSPIEAGTSSSLDEVDGASSSSASMVVVVVVVVLAVLVSMLLFCETLAKTG
jgi:beta-lactamase regulating signal transducer with metallopeptidase domain